MKRKLLIRSGIAMAVLFALVFGIGVGQAYATTGCFTDTNGHWAETFICWMKDNGITTGIGGGNYGPEDNVTRAQMAVFMQKLDELAVSQASLADATNLTAAKAYADASDAINLAAAKAYTDAAFSTGDTYINVGPSGWVPDLYTPGSLVGYTTLYAAAALQASTTGLHYYMLSPALPSSLYNTRMILKGVKLCYDATLGANIIEVELNHYGGSGGLLTQVNDGIVRSDATCRTYLMSTPNEFWGGDFVNLMLGVNFAGTSQFVLVRSATFILSPTTYPAVLSPSGADPRPEIRGTIP